MNRGRTKSNSGFTLVEMMIGLSLSLMVMSAVLSSYVFLGRNFTRTLGISSNGQPNLEAQDRRTMAYFRQDVAMASGISGTPGPAGVTLTLPSANGSTTVTYAFDSTAQTLTRTLADGSAQIIHTSLLTYVLSYYDNAGRAYTIFDSSSSSYSSFAGIKQISFALTSQAGSSANGTLTPVYTTASPRLLLRNRQLLQ